jgi:hypothetical protein
MPASLKSFGGYDWTTNWDAGVGFDDAFGTWGNDVQTRPRPGSEAALFGVASRPREVTAYFTAKPGVNFQTAFPDLMAGLDPENAEPRDLVAILWDGTTQASRPAVIRDPHLMSNAGGVNAFRCTFVSGAAPWRHATPASYGPTAVAAGAGWVAVQADNGGHAPAWAEITLTPTTQAATGDLKYLRELTITNDQTTPVRNWPRLVRLGDTAAWIAETGGAASDGANVGFFIDGVEIRRELIAWDTARTFAWIVIPYLGPGETTTLQIAYGATRAGRALRAEEIAIDTAHVTRTIVAAGSTTTVLNINASITPAGRYDRGRFVILDGAQAGTTRGITSHTGTTITLASALPGVPADGTEVLIQMSDNFQHAWPIIQNDRKTDRTRGLWFADDADDVPGDISFAPAAAWAPSALLPNTDVFAQYEYTRVDIGGPDFDTFTILNAYRTAEGGELVKDVGMADGVSFTAPIDIAGWIFDYAFHNPNGVATAFFGSRTDGGRDYRTVLEDSGDSASLVVASTSVNSLPDGTRHLTANLLPRNGEGIGPTWRADSGTRTGGTSSTLGDATKAWTVDQFAGAVLRIVQGTGAGKKYDVVSNTDDILTISGTFSPALDNTSRYDVRNPPLLANLRGNDYWICEYDDPFTQSAAGSSVACYPGVVRFRLDVGGSPGTDYRTVRVGWGRRIVLLKPTERLVVDCATGRARVEVTATGAFVRDATDAVESIHARAAEDGGDVADPGRMRLVPGDHDIYVENDTVGGWNATISVGEGTYE